MDLTDAVDSKTQKKSDRCKARPISSCHCCAPTISVSLYQTGMPCSRKTLANDMAVFRSAEARDKKTSLDMISNDRPYISAIIPAYTAASSLFSQVATSRKISGWESCAPRSTVLAIFRDHGMLSVLTRLDDGSNKTTRRFLNFFSEIAKVISSSSLLSRLDASEIITTIASASRSAWPYFSAQLSPGKMSASSRQASRPCWVRALDRASAISRSASV